MQTRRTPLFTRALFSSGLATAAIATTATPVTADWSFVPDLPVPNQGTLLAVSGDQTISELNEGFGEPFEPLNVSAVGLSATAYATSSTVGFTNSADAGFWEFADVTVSAIISPIGDQDVLIEWDFGADSAWGGGQIGVFDSGAGAIIFLADINDGMIAGSQTLSLADGGQYQLFAGSGEGTGEAWGTFTAVPGPGAMALVGIAGMAGVGRRRRV